MGDDPPDLSSPEAEEDQAAAEIRAMLRSSEAGGGEAKPIDRLPDPIAAADQAQDVQLKQTYARWLLWVMVGQLMLADVVFVLYAELGRDWDLPPGVIGGWLAATFGEVVGIVLVVTRYLFPRRDTRDR